MTKPRLTRVHQTIYRLCPEEVGDAIRAHIQRVHVIENLALVTWPVKVDADGFATVTVTSQPEELP